ncbi:acetate kinase [bacterium (Candidatus Blackallbacteria) CG17_big_fil_post_rev_8_21_14_2_50_48_46]|uniref:Acetate kinase n=1 Tax=bacterium (Candidatus Blackallbacteria) CG17_big_fil_post_rev_8_21_14_2_50_48_46 TaxID=2014261 RepID=A0A2M7FZW6_9BACT|nr:MAG: acetate kinase [bacterium (Candidatus Blackallbacteria) CG18_big_fil_WC_8_21_14_2_50_49_26]PIW14856.1 MAG: acetate kinase [bacterium (Candidatus Blackallbacteria) CG17_big_fil_post_rev_8_21_14_2_50_48_46]PIW44423.1 MAG: acetate kinase [bacterium (Candidatus Blackallbacteria) CG13_big_fil_rev_8_21_14_2_50_49_14]
MHQAAAILVLNAGSSSLKFSLLRLSDQTELLKGLAERLGEENPQIKFQAPEEKIVKLPPNARHAQALEHLHQEWGPLSEQVDLISIGHRVVHGGERFQEPTPINVEVIAHLKDLIPLAPLHNPANLAGIEAALHNWPEVPQFAVFDTAFHQTLPEIAYRYALPESYYRDHAIRRYGFHGISHRYVSERLKACVSSEQTRRIISAHLGNGCSLAAIYEGVSCDTTMGFTPLEGLMMGTRSGDLDPGILLYLLDSQNMSHAELNRLLNKTSGLLGLSGLSNDVRSLIEAMQAGHAGAKLALEIFAYRTAKAIAALCVPLKGLDTLIFTGGIGENAAWLREKIIGHLGFLGLEINLEKNANCQAQESCISLTHAPGAWVIPTREEWMIAKECALALEKEDKK